VIWGRSDHQAMPVATMTKTSATSTACHDHYPGMTTPTHSPRAMTDSEHVDVGYMEENRRCEYDRVVRSRR
jgi:hypothetical protein